MAAEFGRGDQIIDLAAGDSVTEEGMVLEQIIFTATAAGAFTLVLGAFSVTINLGSNDLTKSIYFGGRRLNHIACTTAPTGGQMFVLLERK
jgi:hypothetical protein